MSGTTTLSTTAPLTKMVSTLAPIYLTLNTTAGQFAKE